METNQKVIAPTIGRKLWFWLNGSKISSDGTFEPYVASDKQALDATVVFVHGDRMVNLLVVDHCGATRGVRSVPLVQPGEDKPQGFYCEWMPFQAQGTRLPVKTMEQMQGEIAAVLQPGALTVNVDLDDASVEAAIQAKGLTAPRVNHTHINELLGRVVFTFDVRPNGSTSTFAHAFLDGEFYLASGKSACVSVENFDEQLGKDIAMSDAKTKAADKLWELEGYLLRDKLQRDRNPA